MRPVQQQYGSQYNAADSMMQSGVQQVERLEQPLQVVDLFKIEQPWKERVEELERYLKQLKSGQTPQPPQPKPQQQA